MISKPMLASVVTDTDLERVEWPALASPKIDGIRILIHPTLGPVTRSFKKLPNVLTREALMRLASWSQLDGELVAMGEQNQAGFRPVLSFNETQSAFMSFSGQPHFILWAFDCFYHPEDPYERRYRDAIATTTEIDSVHIRYVDHKLVHSAEEFAKYATQCLQKGFEGACLRALQGPYKSGRSTLRQGWLLKYKQWQDAEGTVLGFEERMHNANEDIKDHFGHAKRSSHKANMVPMGTLGALILDTAWGELRVGTGFDDATRQDIWDRNMTFLGLENIAMGMSQPDTGRIVTFKYQAFGMQDKPRFPVFKGFREDD